MPLQDLTPQLRTRLSRMEWAVGWFVLFATALLLFGFGYYIYNTAKNKGWFIKKILYHTSIASGAGLKAGDPVKLMGFTAGDIVSVEPNAPNDYYNVTVTFRVTAPNVGYVLSDSVVKVNSGDFLGGRFLEITKGVRGVPTVLEDTNHVPTGKLRRNFILQRQNELTNQFTNSDALYAELNREAREKPSLYYTNLSTKLGYWLSPDESPALADQAQKMVSQIQAALPGILELTNKISAVLVNAADLTSNLNMVADSDIRPAVSNLNTLTAQLKQDLDPLLRNANVTLTNADTNLVMLADDLGRSLNNLADITSNLNQQVQVNSNMLKQISDIVVHSDEFVQGLKRHWLFRSAFKTPNTNQPAAGGVQPFQSPKAASTGH